MYLNYSPILQIYFLDSIYFWRFVLCSCRLLIANGYGGSLGQMYNGSTIFYKIFNLATNSKDLVVVEVCLRYNEFECSSLKNNYAKIGSRFYFNIWYALYKQSMLLEQVTKIK